MYFEIKKERKYANHDALGSLIVSVYVVCIIFKFLRNLSQQFQIKSDTFHAQYPGDWLSDIWNGYLRE